MSQHRRDLRASDADREQVIECLRRAADEGRLRIEELENRLDCALNARTYGQLDAILSDLPPTRRALIERPPRTPVRLPRRSELTRHTGRVGIVLRSPRRALIAGALAAAAVAAPLTAGELAPAGRSVPISRPDARHSNGTFLYDWREENNPNAPHPPVYYVLRANKGEK
jgi:hypothetical protein